MSVARAPRWMVVVALVVTGPFACRLMGGIECVTSQDCPTSMPMCVESVCSEAGPHDAGALDVDAGIGDAGVVDGGPVDGGPLDGGQVDAGLDGGPIDAGDDAGATDAGPEDAGPSDAGVPTAVPIEAPGGHVDFTGALGPSDVTMMRRPYQSCAPQAEDRGPYYLDSFAVVNQTGERQDLAIDALWTGGDGYLLLYRGGFDPAAPTVNCAGGDDDSGSAAGSSVPRFSIAADEIVIIVATTFSVQASIPDYLLEVETLRADTEVDAGPPDAGPGDAGLIDAGPLDAGVDAGEDAGEDAGSDAGADAGPLGPSLIITEVVDHPTNSSVRFVEIHNGGDEDASLANVRLRRYANGQTFPIGSVQLAGTLVPGGTIVAAHDTASLYAMYGVDPDYANLAVDGNGDDVYELVDGTVVLDVYGKVGDDGSGLPWDYTDRVVKRAAGVRVGSTVWEAPEWVFSTDGASATPGQR